MTTSLLLVNGDLTLDANGNIAVCSTEALALAQDAACAIQTYLGEVIWDTTIGIPYQTQIFGQNPPIALLKQKLVDAVLAVSSEIASAQVFFSSFQNRQLSGQVQITTISGQTSAANFQVSKLQGIG